MQRHLTYIKPCCQDQLHSSLWEAGSIKLLSWWYFVLQDYVESSTFRTDLGLFERYSITLGSSSNPLSKSHGVKNGSAVMAVYTFKQKRSGNMPKLYCRKIIYLNTQSFTTDTGSCDCHNKFWFSEGQLNQQDQGGNGHQDHAVAESRHQGSVDRHLYGHCSCHFRHKALLSQICDMVREGEKSEPHVCSIIVKYACNAILSEAIIAAAQLLWEAFLS